MNKIKTKRRILLGVTVLANIVMFLLRKIPTLKKQMSWMILVLDILVFLLVYVGIRREKGLPILPFKKSPQKTMKSMSHNVSDQQLMKKTNLTQMKNVNKQQEPLDSLLMQGLGSTKEILSQEEDSQKSNSLGSTIKDVGNAYIPIVMEASKNEDGQ